MHRLVLLRHGESVWNLENRFSGWADIGLTDTGLAEAKAAGQLLKQKGFVFDVAFTSVLRRAIKTAGVAEVRVPDIGDFKDVPVIEIFVKPGDSVKAEDPLIALESDKATMEVPAPSARARCARSR